MHLLMETVFQGNLLAKDFLCDSIKKFDGWQTLEDQDILELETDLFDICSRFPVNQSPNESQTEDDLIWPVLERLGWTDMLRQQNLSTFGRDEVPDGLLFADSKSKDLANTFDREWRRYEFGLAVVESKRWLLPLNRRSEHLSKESAPGTQMLRYLRRIDDLTDGKIRWGILTNGAHWRLYHSGARFVSEQFIEVDLAAVLGLSVGGHNDTPAPLSEHIRWHCLKVFALIFRRESFLPDATDGQTFHQRAMVESRYFQERVAANLSDLVFGQVYPNLVRAIAAAAPSAPLNEVGDAALVMLYRLLFVLYAEDRGLLPIRDHRYGHYSLRKKVRDDVGRRREQGEAFSTSAAFFWSVFYDLCRVIGRGDASIGLPAYDGGLFDPKYAPLLADIRLDDATMADAIDALSFEQTPDGRRYINYRDLGVGQLGSIYERLLEQDVVFESGEVTVRSNAFARRTSGSFYTPDELVELIIAETIDPLVKRYLEAFRTAAESARKSPSVESDLEAIDPAEQILTLKICDPAMGSGHFLVQLVDYLTSHVLTAMTRVEVMVEGYVSPLIKRIETVRNTILTNAKEGNWAVDHARLDDWHIVRRMVLKRCVYGVDKNPMAVELAKVSLWLHTFTVGAPLSFLDHHLRCGDSLFGAWVQPTIARTESQGGLFLSKPLNRAARAVVPMQTIEHLTDAQLAEANRSAEKFTEISLMTAPLNAFLTLVYAFDWLKLSSSEDKNAYFAWLDGVFGDPLEIAQLTELSDMDLAPAVHFNALLKQALKLIASERFLNWQLAFPGVWSNWDSDELQGGFDAVIGNPPWDRMKLDQVKWFEAKRPEVALPQRASDRNRLVAQILEDNKPLALELNQVLSRIKAATRMAQRPGEYPLLSGGDLNLYSLFVERAMKLVKPDGMIGLLVPSGIASDKTAARFFSNVATEGRLKTFYDFENKKIFFPDVHSSFKFCLFVASPSPLNGTTKYAAFLNDTATLADAERSFTLTAEDFSRVNPNTGTAPFFRSRIDAELTRHIYENLPVLVKRSSDLETKTWPVKYTTMFHMTNDSHRFRTRAELTEEEGAWSIGGNRFDSPAGEWVPLYEGKMVQAFDHRAADITVNPVNRHRPASSSPSSLEQHQNPDWLPEPQYWVMRSDIPQPSVSYLLGFKDVTASTNARSMIATLIPRAGAGNTFPIISTSDQSATDLALLLANLNAVPFDYIVRQKIQGQHLNLYILEQIPVVPRDWYETVCFGPKTAAEIVCQVVLELIYTANDMVPFARDMGFLDDNGEVRSPFAWDERRRLDLRAKLDALYFHLYGITERDAIRHIYSTFSIVEQEESKIWSCYRSCEICLAWLNAFAAGTPDAEVSM